MAVVEMVASVMIENNSFDKDSDDVLMVVTIIVKVMVNRRKDSVGSDDDGVGNSAGDSVGAGGDGRGDGVGGVGVVGDGDGGNDGDSGGDVN